MLMVSITSLSEAVYIRKAKFLWKLVSLGQGLYNVYEYISPFD